MQQAIYNNIGTQANIGIQANIGVQTKQAGKTDKAARVLRWVSHRWDLVGVLTLMGASAAYGVYALAHVGL